MKLARFLLPLLVIALALAAHVDTTEANHATRWTAVCDYNYGIPCYGQSDDTFVVSQWVNDGRAVKWCTNFNSNDKPALQQAITDWQTAFTSSFGNEFVEGSPCELAFTWVPTESEFDSHCGNLGAWACYGDRAGYFDSARAGWYLTGGTIFFDGAQRWTYDRYRAIGAHELGHFQNMWEQYIDPGFQGCWSGNVSIMDINLPGLQWCDAPYLGPTPWDLQEVQWTYSLYPVVNAAASAAGSHLYYSFGDKNWSDSYYAVNIWRYTGSGNDASAGVFPHYSAIAPGEGDQTLWPSGSWTKSPSMLVGYYRACINPFSQAVGTFAPNPPCTPWVYLS